MGNLVPVRFHLYSTDDATMGWDDRKNLIVATFVCRGCGVPIILPWQGGWNFVSIGCGVKVHFITAMRINPEMLEGEEWKNGGG